MKKLLLFISVFVSLSGFSQKIVENEVDEFTGKAIKRTSWEELHNENKIGGRSFNALFRISKINDFYFLDLKLNLDDVFAIKDGEVFLLKFGNGEILNLKNIEYTVSSKGDGGISGIKNNYLRSKQGVRISFTLHQDGIDMLKANKLDKFRIYTTDGYYDKEVSDKKAKKLQDSINLMFE